MSPPENFVAKRLAAHALQKLIKGPLEQNVNGFTIYRRPGSLICSTVLDPELTAFLEPYITRSESGAVVLWDRPSGYLILPPIPIQLDFTFDRWELTPLKEMMGKQATIGVILIRLGRYAIGVYRGQTLIESKTDTRYVHGRNRAGGSSQRRFERRREKQIHELFEKVCEMVRRHLTPYNETLEHIFLGGEAHTIRSFLKHCRALDHFKTRIRRRVLSIRSPNQRSLDEMTTELWGGQVYAISEEPSSQQSSS